MSWNVFQIIHWIYEWQYRLCLLIAARVFALAGDVSAQEQQDESGGEEDGEHADVEAPLTFRPVRAAIFSEAAFTTAHLKVTAQNYSEKDTPLRTGWPVHQCQPLASQTLDQILSPAKLQYSS